MLKKSFAGGFEDRVIAIVEGDLEPQGAVVVQFGRSRLVHRVAFVRACEGEEHNDAGVGRGKGSIHDNESQFVTSVIAGSLAAWAGAPDCRPRPRT